MTPQFRRALFTLRLTLAMASILGLWLQLMDWLFADSAMPAWFSTVRGLTGNRLGTAALVLAALAFVVAVIDQAAGGKLTSIGWIGTAIAVHVCVATAVFSLLWVWLWSATPSRGGGDVASLHGVMAGFIAMVITPVVAIPLSVLALLGGAVLYAGWKKTSREEATGSAATAALLIVVASYFIAASNSLYGPKPASPPASVPRAKSTRAQTAIIAEATDTTGSSLALAASRADVEAVKLLLEKGSSPAVPDPSGYTPLITAVLAQPPLRQERPDFAKEQLEIVEMLLAAGADVDAKDPFGKTALDHAAERGLTDIAKRLRAASRRKKSRS